MSSAQDDAWFTGIQSGDEREVLAAAAERPELHHAVGPMGVGPVLHALYCQRAELARSLLEARGREPDLHECAALGDTDVLEAHLARRPDLEARSGDGFTALHYATYFGHASCARSLLDAGAPVDVEAANPSRVRPLHAALVRPDAELIGLLLKAGADVNAVQAGGYSALHSAYQRGDQAVIDLLIAAGADPDLPADDGSTPPSMAGS